MSRLANPDPKLKFPVSPRTKVFRVIDRQIRTDKSLARYVRPESIKSWTGDPDDKQPFSIGQCPSIMLTPSTGPEQFWATEGMLGTLNINVDMAVTGSCWEDMDGFWYAIQSALYVPNDIAAQNAFVVALQQAGAHKGLCEFSAVVADPDGGEADALIGRAVIRIEYRLNYRT